MLGKTTIRNRVRMEAMNDKRLVTESRMPKERKTCSKLSMNTFLTASKRLFVRKKFSWKSF